MHLCIWLGIWFRFRPVGQICYYDHDNCHSGTHTFGRGCVAKFWQISVCVHVRDRERERQGESLYAHSGAQSQKNKTEHTGDKGNCVYSILGIK